MVCRWFPRHGRRWLRRTMLVLGVSGVGLVLSWQWQSHGGHTNVHADEGKRAPAFTLAQPQRLLPCSERAMIPHGCAVDDGRA